MIIIVYGPCIRQSYNYKTTQKIMKALVYDEYTTNDDFSKILKIKDIPEPKPRPNEVIFRVKLAALNYDDIWGMSSAERHTPTETMMLYGTERT